MSAIVGAAGGAVGAGAAWLIGRISGRKPAWLGLLPVVGIALAVGRSLQPSWGEELMTGLDELPSVQALKAHYPTDYSALQSKIHSLPASSRPDEVRRATAGIFADVLRRQLPKADAERVYALHRVIHGYAAALRETNPRACVQVLEGVAAPTSFAAARNAELERMDMDATSQILAQTATSPAPAATPMPFDELVRFSAAAMATLPDRDQDLAIMVLREARDPRTPEEDRVMCAFNLALSDQLLALSPVDGGAKMRAMQAGE